AGCRVDVLAFREVKIAVAHPGSRGAEEDLVRAGLVDGDVLDLELAGNGAENGGFHRSIPLLGGSVVIASGEPARICAPAPVDRSDTVCVEGAASQCATSSSLDRLRAGYSESE